MAGTALYSAYQNRKAGEEAVEAIKAGQVDPNKVAEDARMQAIKNARESLALEQELTPENVALRRGATKALLPLIGQDADRSTIKGIDRDIAAGGDAGQSELLTESVAEARRQLSLGGELDAVTRNEISRRAIARGGMTGAARFTTPRDLGRTSLELGTERLERGGRFGQLEQGRFQKSFENLNRLRELREQLQTGRQTRGIQLAGFGQKLQAPSVGLAPGEFAGLSISNQNLLSEAGVRAAENRATNAANIGQAITAGVGAIGEIPAVKNLPIFSKG